jgi:hypothetical protein
VNTDQLRIPASRERHSVGERQGVVTGQIRGVHDDGAGFARSRF